MASSFFSQFTTGSTAKFEGDASTRLTARETEGKDVQGLQFGEYIGIRRRLKRLDALSQMINTKTAEVLRQGIMDSYYAGVKASNEEFLFRIGEGYSKKDSKAHALKFGEQQFTKYFESFKDLYPEGFFEGQLDRGFKKIVNGFYEPDDLGTPKKSSSSSSGKEH